MVDIIKQTETVLAYPPAPSGLSDKAAALSSDMLWQRIESYICHRFSQRDVVWLIEACAGDQLELPLMPLIGHTAERWFDDAWTEVDLLPGPYGFYMPSNGSFRITAQIGQGPVPALAEEAFRRLASYSAAISDEQGGTWFSGRAGTSDFSGSLDSLSQSGKRSASWAAKALINSGAADLLRPYRQRGA